MWRRNSKFLNQKFPRNPGFETFKWNLEFVFWNLKSTFMDRRNFIESSVALGAAGIISPSLLKKELMAETPQKKRHTEQVPKRSAITSISGKPSHRIEILRAS